jgi:sarcosine oxidase subunit alpha
VQNGGVLEAAGFWMRPRYYQGNGSDVFAAGVVEAARVRAQGGIMDASTLGKIEIVGQDAAAFLDSLYLSPASTIRVGRSKYMVNLREDGMVLDDGIVMRLAADRFIAMVSSGHADHMVSHFNFWRDVRWSGRAIALTDVTEAWGVIAVAGPASRSRLQQVLGATWQDALASLAHMELADGHWQGVPLRMLRASFSGELAFELHCRPHGVLSLWQALVDSGLAPYGLEALDILRVEKGYLVSAEINGQTTPADLCMEAMLKSNNACVGRALLDRPAFAAADRPQLVGLRAADSSSRFLAGAQITLPDERVRSSGYVTSAVYSPTLQQWIGLALIDRRLTPEGTRLVARDPVRSLETQVIVVPPVHFDRTGARMKA